jgi:hypothetical protein
VEHFSSPSGLCGVKEKEEKVSNRIWDEGDRNDNDTKPKGTKLMKQQPKRNYDSTIQMFIS